MTGVQTCALPISKNPGKTLADFDNAPYVRIRMGDDVAACRDAIRPGLAFYIGGMGARSKNFYNDLVKRMGYEDAAARIQDLYGINASVCICANRVPILIHVLAPNHRPLQITQNLSTFWAEVYPKVKPELQRRYPRHEWR